MIDAVLERLHSLHPKSIDLSLGRMGRLLADLDHPERRLPPVVHIAGTNGKGSTLAALRAIAETAGLRVHAYTSPHLVRFAERIRVAGELIAEDRLTDLLCRCEWINEGRPITFFEITTAAALVAFAETPADLCLLETGMGGRLDATNVVARPQACLLAPISMDHEDFLGSTLSAIASEKAGILKPGVPCLTARQKEDAFAVIEARARDLGVPLLIEGRDWNATPQDDGFAFTMAGDRAALPLPCLKGRHQVGNAALAIAAARTIAAAVSPDLAKPSTWIRAMGAIDWPARLQRLTQGRLVETLGQERELWLDGGHNPGAGEVLAEVASGWSDRPLDLVVGMLTTKDSLTFLSDLAPYVRSLAAVTIPGEPLTREAAEVATLARRAGIASVFEAGSVPAALTTLSAQPGPARILICGSLYLAGTVLAANG